MSKPNTCLPLPARKAESHKGSFGTVVVIGGCPTMIGAPAFTAKAALTSGCGLAKLALPEKIILPTLTLCPAATAIKRPNENKLIPTWLKSIGANAILAIGPGMGDHKFNRAILKTAWQQKRPMVIDADGLNTIAKAKCKTPPKAPTVLTPHPGEARRLAEAYKLEIDPVSEDKREHAAMTLANFFNATIVLKGHHTLISDGAACYKNTTGNPALASAGSGDVLTGLIASLAAQGMPMLDAARCGVYLLGKTADLWAAEYGPTTMGPEKIVELLPHVLKDAPREQ